MDESPSTQKNLKLSQELHSENPSDLAKEWNLFWQGLRARNLPSIEESDDETPVPMTVEQVHSLSKALSSERKTLHRKLEALHKEIDLNSTKLETLKLVGSDEEDTVKRLNELNDQGMNISTRLQEIDEQIKEIRGFEEKLTQVLE